MAIQKINAAGLEIVKRNEGLELQSYQDTGGVWTIGRGHTPATPGQKITLAQADALLAADIGWAEDAVNGATHDVATTGNQFSAMVSLTFNIGSAGFRRSSVLRLHREGDTQGAADAFRLWNQDNGVALAGLTRRRAEERALYLTADTTAPGPPAPTADVAGAVRALQTVTLAAGLYHGAVDGDPGPLTIAALRAWRAT